MERSGTSRGALLVGVLLIVLGAGALAVRVSGLEIGWPIWVIVPGIAFLLAAFAIPEPAGSGLAAVGGIIVAAGGVLAVQSATDAYASWAYAWALVAPGGVGAALLLYGLVARRGDIARGGLGSLVTGVVLFLVGFLFFEGVLHISGDRFGNLGDRVVPIVIMGIGAVVLVGALVPGPWRSRRWRDPSPAPSATAWATGGMPSGAAGAGTPPAGDAAPQVLALGLEGATDAEVRVVFGAGTLQLGPAASGQLVDGTFDGGVAATPAGPGRVRLTTPHPASWSWDWGRAPFTWRMGVTAEVPLRLEVETGASDNEIDLSGLRVTDLRLRTGAAQSRVTLPAAGVTRVSAEGGAAQMRFRVPPGVAARITSTMAIGTTDVDLGRFPRTADGAAWASPDFDSNPNRVEVTVRGGVGQVTIG